MSANQGYTEATVFSDNDSLAALVAKETNAELLILLTDVGGVYDKPPSQVGGCVRACVSVDPKIRTTLNQQSCWTCRAVPSIPAHTIDSHA